MVQENEVLLRIPVITNGAWYVLSGNHNMLRDVKVARRVGLGSLNFLYHYNPGMDHIDMISLYVIMVALDGKSEIDYDLFNFVKIAVDYPPSGMISMEAHLIGVQFLVSCRRSFEPELDFWFFNGGRYAPTGRSSLSRLGHLSGDYELRTEFNRRSIETVKYIGMLI